MARDIKALLNKKKWTGTEIGRALMAGLIYDVKNLGKGAKPLFTQKDLERMEASLAYTHDCTAYDVYRSIYSSVIESFNKAQGLHQQFYNGFYRHLMYVNEVKTAEDALKEEIIRPLIMTQAQYDRIASHILEERRSWPVSLRSMTFALLDEYLQADDDEGTPETVIEALDALTEEPVKNKRILENYNRDMGRGYLTLSDGRRSDQMSKEEWSEAITAEWIKGYELYINGELASPEETLIARNQEIYIRTCRLVYEGTEGIEKELDRLGLTLPEGVKAEEILGALGDRVLNQTYEGIEFDSAAYRIAGYIAEGTTREIDTWNYYPEPPDDLTKYDILTDVLGRYEGHYSTQQHEGKTVKGVSETAAFTEFRKDYPALFAALKKEIERLLPNAKGLKANQYGKTIATYGELADKGIAPYTRYLTVDKFDISEYYASQPENTYLKRRRICLAGVAIIQDTDSADDAGDYIEAPYPLKLFKSIDTIADSSEDRKEIKTFRESLIKPALRYLYAYNELIEAVCTAYGIEEWEYLRHDLSTFESQLRSTNELIYWISAHVYGDSEELKRKQALIREIFIPIDPEELKPSEKAVKRVRERIQKLGYTKEAFMRLQHFETFIAEIMGEDD